MVAAAAWGVLLTGYALGREGLISHDVVLESGEVSLPLAVGLFVAAWQVMIAAMMLPTTVPAVHTFARRAGVNGGGPWVHVAVFLAAYFVIWTAFGVIALTGDAAVHTLAHSWEWLDRRPALVTAAVLGAAGIYQFLPVKARCLARCRNPDDFLGGDGGRTGAWSIGIHHGIACLGSSWALMLVMFGVGVHALWVILVLTIVLVAEKTTSVGARAVPVVGAALIAAAVAISLGVA